MKLSPHMFAHMRGLSDSGSGRATNARNGSLDVHRVGALLGPSWKCLDPLIISHLQLQLANRADGKVHLAGLIIAKARAERLGEQPSLEFSYCLLAPDDRGAGYKALEAAVLSCLRLTGALPYAGASEPYPVFRCTATTPLSASDTTSTNTSTSIGAHDPCSSSNNIEGSGGGSTGGSSSSSCMGNVQMHVAAVCRWALLHAAAAMDTSVGTAAGGAATGDVYLSYEEYCKWTKKCPALHKTLCSVLRRIGAPTPTTAPTDTTAATAASTSYSSAAMGISSGTTMKAAAAAASMDSLRLPVLRQLGKLPAGSTLLQPVWTWALASRLPSAQRIEWRLLFSAQRDGKSFSTFFGRVSASPGPTLLLMRDSRGALLGGYASQPWSKRGSYYGDVSSFIFSLLPVMQIFPATGINDNFQWCGVGFSQLPGGLGFGGAAAARGHFALYVDPTLDMGMSRPIATYGNTPLASEQVFQIDDLECWLLQPPEEDSPGAGEVEGGGGPGGGGSILGKAAEDRAILELAGLKMHSAGLRDEPLEE